jgi:hypothetical protein
METTNQSYIFFFAENGASGPSVPNEMEYENDDLMLFENGDEMLYE